MAVVRTGAVLVDDDLHLATGAEVEVREAEPLVAGHERGHAR